MALLWSYSAFLEYDSKIYDQGFPLCISKRNSFRFTKTEKEEREFRAFKKLETSFTLKCGLQILTKSLLSS